MRLNRVLMIMWHSYGLCKRLSFHVDNCAPQNIGQIWLLAYRKNSSGERWELIPALSLPLSSHRLFIENMALLHIFFRKGYSFLRRL